MDSDRGEGEEPEKNAIRKGAGVSEGKMKGPRLEWRDYVALSIAAIQSILLPLVILIAVLLFLVLALSVLR